MKRLIRASESSSKVCAKGWNNFVQQLEEQTDYKVDSAFRRRYDQWIVLLKDGKEYDAEVTHYGDGEYELMLYNITPVPN